MIRIKPIKPLSKTLSPAEQRVYDLLVKGVERNEIADALCISRRTVKYHLASIYKRLGVSGQTQVIALHYMGEEEFRKYNKIEGQEHVF